MINDWQRKEQGAKPNTRPVDISRSPIYLAHLFASGNQFERGCQTRDGERENPSNEYLPDGSWGLAAQKCLSQTIYQLTGWTPATSPPSQCSI